MPVIWRHKGYRFYFYSNEGSILEPPHVHVRDGERVAKFWLSPDVALADSWGMNRSELTQLRRLVEEHREEFERAWHERFP
jgi:hypothetical protein